MKLSTPLVTLAAALLIPTVGAAAAQAQPSGTMTAASATRCSPDGSKGPWYTVSNRKDIFIPARGDSRIYGDPGTTLSITKGTSWTVGASVTGTTTAEASAVIAKAAQSFSVQLSAARTTSTTTTGTWTVPKKAHEGWLEVGTKSGSKFSWKQYSYNSSCRKIYLKSGTAKVPAKKAALKYRHS